MTTGNTMQLHVFVNTLIYYCEKKNIIIFNLVISCTIFNVQSVYNKSIQELIITDIPISLVDLIVDFKCTHH